jgi:hypothetical protein
MCVPNVEYQWINPNTQVSLYSFCVNNCSAIEQIQWHIFVGMRNSSLNVTTWTEFNQTNVSSMISFFGTNTANFTVTKDLFLSNRHLTWWRFEVIYQSSSKRSSSSMSFLVNEPPSNGSCSISPSNGTTSTVFNLICEYWMDPDTIKDYSLYSWREDLGEEILVVYSSVPQLSVRLPPGDEQTSQLNLFVSIRDRFDCSTRYNLTSTVYVQTDLNELNALINGMSSSSLLSLLYSENQNSVSQIITSFSTQLNRIDMDNLDEAISSKTFLLLPLPPIKYFSRWNSIFDDLHILIDESIFSTGVNATHPSFILFLISSRSPCR